MTDRYNAFVVVLDSDLREDDAEAVIAAIELIRGVASVTPNVTDVNSLVAVTRARQEMREKLVALLDGLKP